MRHFLAAGTLCLALGATAAAQAASPEQEIGELKRTVAALLERIDRLERAVASPAVSPSAAGGAALGSRVAALEESHERQTDALAQARVAAQDGDWVRRIRWKGDLRYRHEHFDIEGASSDRVRHRIRARLGMEAKVSSSVTAGFQIATGEISDPRSTNATLDDAGRRKDIAIDLAYADWKPFDGAVLTLGKQKQPWFEHGDSAFFDGDLHPEGAAFRYASAGGWFANAWGYWLEESSSGADSNLIGAQVGYRFPGGLTVAAGYWDYGAVEGQPVLNFSGAPAGNSSFLAGANCLGVGTTRCYRFDYDVVIAGAEWVGEFGGMPLVLYGGWLQNTAVDDLDRGYNAGFSIGEAREAGSWEFGLLYQDVEQDAQFSGFLDSDFADGLTQGRGFQLQGAWAPVKNMTVKGAYFLNDRSYDTPAEADYKRLQLDLNYRF